MKELEELTRDIREKLPRLKGQFPMLNDVLEWYDEHVEINENNGQGFYTRGFYDQFENWLEWDMSKPFLKHQSPELIKFLHGLIKK